jgi:hypothetical protein
MIDPNKVISDCEQADHIMQDQRAEIDRLKEALRRLADQDATLSVCNGNVTVTMDATLDDAEREAIEWSINDQIAGGHQDHPTVKAVIAVLRALLERTK